MLLGFKFEEFLILDLGDLCVVGARLSELGPERPVFGHPHVVAVPEQLGKVDVGQQPEACGFEVVEPDETLFDI